MLLYYSYLLPLILSAIASLTAVRLDWPKTFKHFSFFLTATVCVEVFAFCWSYKLYHTDWWNCNRDNLWLYNAYLIPQYLFYIYFFSQNIGLQWIKKLAWPLSIFFVLIALGKIILFNGLLVVNSITIILASLIIVFFTITYFIHLMKAKTVVRLSRQPMFWISVGTFIFHLGSIPCFMLYEYISAEDPALASSLFRIIVALNFLMYSIYTTAFLCTRRYLKSPF